MLSPLEPPPYPLSWVRPCFPSLDFDQRSFLTCPGERPTRGARGGAGSSRVSAGRFLLRGPAPSLTQQTQLRLKGSRR